MKIIAKRYVDNFAPGAELPAGRYDEATLTGLLDKGHFAVVEDEEPGTPNAIEDPNKAQAAADKQRAAAVKQFAAKDKGDASLTAELPQPVTVERIPEAKSDTVTRIAPAGSGDEAEADEKGKKTAKK